jgi:small subunit ribosomal protein S6
MTEQYKGVIEANGGKVAKVEPWGVKSLAYRIKQEPQGAFHADQHRRSRPAAVAEMERQMRSTRTSCAS